MSIDVSQYKVGVIVSLQECSKSKSSSKLLRACQIDIGEDSHVTIVTSATNVREGSRVAVALAGSTVVLDGEEITVARTSVGGTMSDGMICDSKLLGWTGGSAGVAQVIPDECPLGLPPPKQKPRPLGTSNEGSELNSDTAVKGLFEKKLTKEEKKKIAEERKKARAAKKAAGNDDGDGAI
jgi:tRNA-binding EMAP/Myf-like protein